MLMLICIVIVVHVFFFFKQKTAYEMRISDWSSDVCSSDLVWSPWVDVPHDYHYDQIAESTIPDKHGDPFWPKAARGTLVAVLRKLAAQGRTYVDRKSVV